MDVSGIKNAEAVNANYSNAKKEVKQENVQPNNAGYAQKEEAPTNANLYKAMYGLNNKSAKTESELKAEYDGKLAEARAKYEAEVNNLKAEYDEKLAEARAKNEVTVNDKKGEKSFYEQYLDFKHKYE